MRQRRQVRAAVKAGVVTAAERAMAATLGTRVGLSYPTPASKQQKTLVLRCHVETAPGTAVPPSVIIKLVDMADFQVGEPVGAAASLFNDWAGAQFLSDLAAATPASAPFSPRFYGGDRAAGLIVLEDLGGGPSLVEPLCGRDPGAAAAALTALAVTLGRLHAATIGREDAYWSLRRVLGPTTGHTFMHSPQRMRAELPELYATLAGLGVAPSDACRAEIEATLVELEQPGPFQAYTRGDPCPANQFWRAGTLRLYDYERGAYRHALIDGVYPHMQFPTCWCAGRMPDDVVARVEAAYRSALLEGCPAAGDDRVFAQAVVQAAAYWVCVTLERGLGLALAKDVRWGLATMRPRLVTRAEAFARLAEARGYLPHTAHLAYQLSAELRQRWPAKQCELAMYPAFQ
jgi:hypothetical protein